jgi:type II secretory ATPase GspE/PulE/Tfp pilus assembly ATPase PilB-like protein
MDMDVPAFLVAAVLNIIVAQRLVRRIHLDCIESYSPESEILETVRGILKDQGVDPSKMPKSFYRGRGCKVCNGLGYMRRAGIFEILNITEETRRLIIGGEFNLDNLRKMARDEGMVTMIEDGLKKVERGMTTIEEILRVIRE